MITNILVHGCSGKMGKNVCRLLEADRNCHLVAGVDKFVNEDIYTFLDLNEMPEDIEIDVIIDFSTASAVDNLVDYCVSKKVPAVICTTGLSDSTIEHIKQASKEVAIFKSANMSLGINLISNVLKKISPVLDEAGFDIEIVEKHHNQKLDAPSGTALLLADSINESMDNKFDYVYDRSKELKKRDRKELGIHAVRGGTIVGDHSVIYAGTDEIVEINHFAHSKEVFAVGAIKAAKFLKGKGPGMYDMQDVMNEIFTKLD